MKRALVFVYYKDQGGRVEGLLQQYTKTELNKDIDIISYVKGCDTEDEFEFLTFKGEMYSFETGHNVGLAACWNLAVASALKAGADEIISVTTRCQAIDKYPSVPEGFDSVAMGALDHTGQRYISAGHYLRPLDDACLDNLYRARLGTEVKQKPGIFPCIGAGVYTADFLGRTGGLDATYYKKYLCQQLELLDKPTFAHVVKKGHYYGKVYITEEPIMQRYKIPPSGNILEEHLEIHNRVKSGGNYKQSNYNAFLAKTKRFWV